MDQQQFKIGMSVSTKLLIIISLLLATPIFFINVSAINLFRADKKAYIYDGEATAAILMGREFVSYLDSSLSTLKLAVGTADLSGPLTDQAKNTINFYVDNQRSLIGIDLFGFDQLAVTLTRVHQKFLPTLAGSLGSKPSDIQVDDLAVGEELKEIQKRGYGFRNISQEGHPPMLAVFFADFQHAPAKGPMPVAVGYISLGHFLAGASSLNKFTVADSDGAVLFESDEKALNAHSSVSRDLIFQEALLSPASGGAKEYINPRGVKTLGSYYKPGLDLVVLSQIDYEQAMQATYTLTEKFVVLGVASMAFMIVLGLLFSRRMTAPLNRLFLATTQVSGGNFKVNLPITSRDEIGALTASFVAMSERIHDLVKGTADKVRVDQELEIVKTVHQALFPPARITNDQLTIVNHYESALECGGDWFGYSRNGNRHMLVMADATGHGLSSALMTASTRGCFSVIEKLMSSSQTTLSPAEILDFMNRVVFNSGQSLIMMTAFVGVLDFDTRTLTYASAAHNPPWLIRTTAEGVKHTSLIAMGSRLGEAPDTMAPYELKTVQFAKGDTLFIYTDGLLEGKSKTGQPYGKKQVRRVIEDALAKDPNIIIETLMADFIGYNAGKRLDDDVTIAVVRVNS